MFVIYFGRYYFYKNGVINFYSFTIFDLILEKIQDVFRLI